MRLIDADAAKRKIIEAATNVFTEITTQTFTIVAGMANMFDCENDFPTIDAEPVKHEKWIDVCCGIECSNCGEEYSDEIFFMRGNINYCPNCGAKMDGGFYEKDTYTIQKSI